MNIRNFAIIAHIDHGKSTLADRLLELTHVVQQGAHNDQMLDRNPISRERGITIKLAPVRMNYAIDNGQLKIDNEKTSVNLSTINSQSSIVNFTLNLIDTPGHVDFAYEVDRTLSCVEGVVLLVDATQGIQAQTIANAYKAIEKNLVIIPVVNKIDLPGAQVEATKQAIVDFLGIPKDTIHEISAKTGLGVPALFETIIRDIPDPFSVSRFPFTDNDTSIDERSSVIEHGGANTMSNSQATESRQLSTENSPLRALIFDSYYDSHKGVIAFVRVFEGSVKKGDKLRLAIGNINFETTEVGYFTPDLVATNNLAAGDIGYVVTNLKDIHDVRVGDTIIAQKSNSVPLAGYQQVRSMVYASMFPTDTADYLNLKKALEKLYLNDSSLEFSAIFSQALGAGFRVGFLGLLHADVVRERLEREYDLSLVLTPPQVEYKHEDGQFFEPYVRVMVLTPHEHMGTVMQLLENYRGVFKSMDNKNQISVVYEMPMSEMIGEFFDKLKSATSGYASLDWEFAHYVPVKADKLLVLINLEPIEEFSEIVVAERAQEKGQELTRKLRELIPRQQYEIKIQAQFKGKIIASERLAPYRKDVLTKGSKTVGGGDYGRKRKLLEKQKEGKKKMKMVGKVEVPKEAFLKLFNKNG